MKKNIGRLDQLLRMGISLVLIFIGFIDETLISDSLSSNIIGGIGVLFFGVALVRSCPLYTLTGINTCPTKKQ